jgi:hypothetical protein
MSAGNYTAPITLQSAGNVITSADHNAEHANHKNNMNPAGNAGYQDTLAQKKLQEDPATGLVTSLAKELEQLRFAIKRILGNKTWWYEAPDNDLAGFNKRTYALLTIGAAGAVTVTAGANVASAVYASDELTITFTNAFSNANYVVNVTGEAVTGVTNGSVLGGYVKTSGKTTTTCAIIGHKRDGTTQAFTAGEVLHISIPTPYA